MVVFLGRLMMINIYIYLNQLLCWEGYALMIHITCIQVDKREAQISSVISQHWPAQVFHERPLQEP